MLFLSRARLAISHGLLKPTVLGRGITSYTRSGLCFLGNNKYTNKELFRNYSSSEENNKNAMTLTKTTSNRSSTLESGTINVIKVPSLGKNFKKCKIYKWFKNPGDFVNVNDLLCIVETDLIFGKVYSQIAGTIIENVNQEGSTVSVGSDLVVLVDNPMLSSSSTQSKTSGFSANQRRHFSTKKYVPMISFTRMKQPEGSKYAPSLSFGRSVLVGGEKSPVELKNQMDTAGSQNTSGNANNVDTNNSANNSNSNSNNTSNSKEKGKAPFVLDDFYKSPYRSWFRTLTEEEIEMVNHGTIDVK